MNPANLVHIGTSGWHYDHWRGAFYPDSLPKNSYLEYYCDHFHTLEINNSFYQMPQERTMVQWRNGVPDSFIFSLKASRYITHIKKLKDGRQILSPFIKKVETLGDKLGPVLFQLPPQWRFNPERLRTFLKALPQGYPYAFEFRDSSWFVKETYDILSGHNAALGVYHVANRTSPCVATANFVYLRMHGTKGASQGSYGRDALSDWADIIMGWAGEGKEVFCYFDNDESGFAARNALTLQEIVWDRTAADKPGPVRPRDKREAERLLPGAR